METGQLAYILLVVLMGTVWGVVSLRATTSKMHWALRLIVVGLLLGLFLKVPAYEPILFFALQLIVVAVGVLVCGRSEREPKVRFSIKSLLVTTLVVGLLLTVGVRTDVPSWRTWAALIAGSISLGLATLFAVWTLRPWTWSKLFLSLVGLVVAAITMGFCDALLLYFPEWDRAAAPSELFGSPATKLQIVIATSCIWFLVLAVAYALQILLVHLASTTKTDAPQKTGLGRVGVVCLLAAITTPLVWLLICIPPAIPERSPSVERNGYDVLQSVANRYKGGATLDFADQLTDTQLTAALLKHAKEMSLFREMSELPFEPPRTWDINAMIADAQTIRAMARAFAADSDLAQRQGRLDDVVHNSLDVMEVAQRTNRNMMMGLVSVAVEAVAHQPFVEIRKKLNPTQTRRAMEGLIQIDEVAPTFEEMQAREFEWALRTWGWRVQIYRGFTTAYGIDDDLFGAYEASRHATARITVVRRMLLIDLAIRSHQHEKNVLPRSLEELNLDTRLLIDEFSKDQSQIRYELVDDTFTLYSVGPDGADNQGVPIPDQQWVGDGDLVLEALFPGTSEIGESP